MEDDKDDGTHFELCVHTSLILFTNSKMKLFQVNKLIYFIFMSVSLWLFGRPSSLLRVVMEINGVTLPVSFTPLALNPHPLPLILSPCFIPLPEMSLTIWRQLRATPLRVCSSLHFSANTRATFFVFSMQGL